MEVLQERLLGVLGSLVCATLFPPGGVEPLRMFCCAYVEPPSPSSAKRGAAWVGEGDAVEGETALSAAELRARGQERFAYEKDQLWRGEDQDRNKHALEYTDANTSAIQAKHDERERANGRL